MEQTGLIVKALKEKKFRKMKHRYLWQCLVPLLFLAAPELHAEYRAYELEVYDLIQKKSEVVITSFSPSDYLLTHGGPQRVGVIIRASWICYGDTSGYQKVCPIPQPVNPRFKVGERVQVLLPHHVADQWVGTIENSFFRPDLKSNVYGVRFPEQKNLYTRFYEANLQKAP